jgi:hypothetical protein
VTNAPQKPDIARKSRAKRAETPDKRLISRDRRCETSICDALRIMSAIDFDELQWARIRDARRFCTASRATIYNWIADGLIRSRRINGARYIDMESLRRLFAKAPEKPPKKVSREMTLRALKSADARAKE